jgi:hypothetical protein
MQLEECFMSATLIRQNLFLLPVCILWWNESIFCGKWYSKMIFTLQMSIVWNISGLKPRNSCRNRFMRLEVLPLHCEYIYSLMNFNVNIYEHFQTNSFLRGVNTRNRTICTDLLSSSHVFENVHNTMASRYSTVYHIVSSLMNKKVQFKVVLYRYFNMHSFYSIKDFIIFKKI